MSTAELGFRIDSSGAKAAAVDLDALVSASQRAERAERDVGRASREAQGGVRSLASAIKQLTEAENRAAGSQFAERRARDIAAYGQELDRLRAKFNPLFAASKGYEARLDELNRAHRVGAIGTREYENALEMLNAEFRMVQSGAMGALAAGLGTANVAMRQSGQMSRQLMFQMVDLGQTIPLALQSPIFALQNMGFQFAQIGQLYFGQGGMQAALRDMASMSASAARGVGNAAMSVLALARAHPIASAAIAATTFAVGGLVAGLFESEEATEKASDALDDFTGDLGAAESQIRGLETAALAYAESIGATSTAQTAATGSIIADTRREFQAKQQLLELEIKRREALQAEARAGIAAARGQVSAARSSLERLPGITPPPGLSEERIAATRQGQMDRLNEMIAEAADEQDRLNAEFTLGDIALNKLREAASMTFEELAAGANEAGAGGGAARAAADGASAIDEAEREAERLREAYRDIVASGEQFIAQQQLEQRTLGMSQEAAARLRHEFEFLNEAQQAGLELTPEQTERLRDLAGAMASAEEQTALLTERQREMQKDIQFASETATGAFKDTLSALRDGETGWRSYANIAIDALDRVVDKLLNDVLDAIFKVNEASTGGGGGGLFGKLLGFLGFGATEAFPTTLGGANVGNFGYARGGAFSAGREITAFASGGIVDRPTLFPMANGMGLMGEAGPEAVMPLARTRSGDLGVRTEGKPGGGDVYIDARGADQAAIARLEGIIRTELAPGKIERRALNHVVEQRRRNPDLFGGRGR